MYGYLGRQYYWQHLPAVVQNMVLQCQSCRRHRPVEMHQKMSKLFLPSGPLASVAKDIFGPLARTKQENLFIAVMTDLFSSLTWTIIVGKISTTNLAKSILDNWIISYGAPSIVFTNNGEQFVSEFFAVLCPSLGIKSIATTEYYSQTYCKLDRYKGTLVARLRHYIDRHQQD